MPAPDLPQRVFGLLSNYEKFKDKPYRDSNKKLWTIGYGTLIGDGSDDALSKSPYKGKSIDEAEAAKIAKGDVERKTNVIRGLIGAEKFDKFSPELQAHLVSGAYRGDITGSPKTIKLLQEGDFEGAAKEYVNNDEYRRASTGSNGVVKRMNDAAAVMAKEKPVDFSTAVEVAISRAKDFVGPPLPESIVKREQQRIADAMARGESVRVRPLRIPNDNE
jgi:GH24 family phage-related lysozyme (muramidase)